MKTISTIISAAAACFLLPSVQAHGYLSVPKSRNLVAHQRKWNEGPRNYNHFSLSSGSRRATPLVYPSTEQAALGHGLCGDAPKTKNPACWNGGDCPEQEHMPGGRFYTKGNGQGGRIQATYSAGQTIDVEMYITAHHKGAVTLRLCDEARVTEKCLNKYGPLKRVDFEQGDLREAQPINPKNPEFWYLNPTAYAPAKVPGKNHYKMHAKFQLPEGVTCENCVLQWWWITGNNCVAPGHRNMNFAAKYQANGGFFNKGPDCVGTKRAEEFWNCADISIKASGNKVAPKKVAVKKVEAKKAQPAKKVVKKVEAKKAQPAKKVEAKKAQPAKKVVKKVEAKKAQPAAKKMEGIVRESCVSFEAVAGESGQCTGFLAAAAKHLRVNVKDIKSFGYHGKVHGNVPVCKPGADGTFATAQNKGLWAKVKYQVCATQMGPCKQKRRFLRGGN